MAATAGGQAPGRVNLIGEHTDYNAGLALPLTIPYATTARATRRDDTIVVIRSDHAGTWRGAVGSCGPGDVRGWAAYAAGVLWALSERGREIPGMDLDVTSTVPVGAGLSSSAALEAAVALAVTALLDEPLTAALRAELVEVCRSAESDVVGAPTGGLDQAAVLTCLPGAALLIDFEDGSTRMVDLGLDAAGLALVVVDTRVSHALVDGGYGTRRAQCERAGATLGRSSLRGVGPADLDLLADPVLRHRARHVVTENARVEEAVAALEGHDWEQLGRLLDASHASLRDDFDVSCRELDLAVETARRSGALGARMTGGGFGGSAIALVPAGRVYAMRRAVDAAFAAAGFAPPAHLDGFSARTSFAGVLPN